MGDPGFGPEGETPVNVLHLNTFDIDGGAARAAWRIHQGLRSLGTDSLMLVQTKTSGDASVMERNSLWARWLGQKRHLAEIPPLLPYRGRPATHWATGWLPAGINRQITALTPDIIHLHWICRGFMSIPDIGRLTRPVVWTLHDSWAFTGGCHVPGSCLLYRSQCGQCPQLNSHRENDLSRRIWNRKNRHWGQTPITVVAPSQWLADCARQSSLFRERRIEVIPNGIDTGLYHPITRQEARAKLALPQDRKLVLISAMNATRDRNKGFHFLQDALQRLAGSGWREKMELLVVGQSPPPDPVNTGVPTRFMGVFKDEASMVQAYSAADVTVLPSIQENLPNAIMESMACGTPVVAFGVGGIPQLVEHGTTGYVARPEDSADLAAGLNSILSDPERQAGMGRKARLKIEREFTSAVTARRYLSLYEQLLR